MNHLHQFSTSMFEHDFPCACITLRARKALRVMCNQSLGAKPFPGLSPRQGRPNSICSSLTLLFRKFRSFPASCPNLCLLVTFSKTHRRTQQLHSWIGLDLKNGGKLVRSETNSQTLRNLHFCEPFTPIFDKHVATRFPLPVYYS